MEVTSTSPSQLNAKLGDIKSQDVTNDLFASHLADASKADREPTDRSRSKAREADDKDSPRESAASRDETDEARDSDETEKAETDNGEANENTTQAEGEATTAATDSEAGAFDELAEALAETEAVLGDEGKTVGNTAEGDSVTSSGPQLPTGEAQEQSQSDAASAAETGVTAIADQDQSTAETLITGNNNAAQAGPSEQSAANAALTASRTDASTQQTNQATNGEALQAANRSNQAKADGTQAGGPNLQSAAADGEDGIDLTFGDLADDDGNLPKGERGLGHQMAESLSNKPAATGPQNQTAPASSATTPQVAAAPAASPVTPTLGALGGGSLPADTSLEILGQNSSTGAPTNLSPQNNNPIMVRFGALPGQAQATQVPNTAIAMQIAKHVAKGVSTFEIRLDPPEMGRIDVKMEMAQDGRVTAHLAVEKSETLDLLQRDAKALEQALRDAGLDADSDTLNFSLKQESDQGGQLADSNGSDAESTDDAPEGDALMSMLAARQIEAAARGGVDVSI